MSELERFFRLFRGYSNAYGTTTVTGTEANGKAKANSFIVREPLTLELMEQHLGGFMGIGAIPIDEKSLSFFGALDIDDYNLDLVGLLEKIRRFKLPLVLCRSKSGGAHLYLFLSEAIPAVEIRDKLAEFASILGWGTCEIFPKQDEVRTERGDVGNFINLPYHNAEYTTRYALDKDGEPLTLAEFLDLAESCCCTPDALRSIKEDKESVLPDGPPCLQQLSCGGIPEGGRNNTLLNVGVYFRQAHPETWAEKLEEYNRDFCSPALPAREIVTIQNQLEKKNYFYTCKQEPLHSHCNRAKCRLRKFGIGNGQAIPMLSGLTVVESEPPVWFLDVDGSRLELSTKQLQMQQEFQRAAMEQMYKMPAKMKEAEWRDLVDGLLENATKIDVPDELTHKGLFVELVENFCISRLQAHSAEELVVGKPWTEDGYTYFKLSALQDFLKRHNFTHYTRGQITERLKEMNDGDKAMHQYRYKDDRGEWRNVRVWGVPEVNKGDVELPAVEVEDDEVPF